VNARVPITDSTLRFLRLWQVVGVLLIGLVIYLSLTPYPIDGIPVENGDKYDHLLAYATLMFWFAQIHEQSRVRLCLALALIGMGRRTRISAAPHRFPDLRDWGYDGQRHRRMRRLDRVAATLAAPAATP
jgi:hypothetical protein